MMELTEIMRQKDDRSFAKALNGLAKGDLSVQEEDLFKSRETQPHEVPQNTLHLFATNAEVKHFNDEALQKLNTEGAVSVALDKCQGDASEAVKATFMERAKSLPPNETYGLPSELDLKVTARYMMTVNVCTEDGLVNGATGTLKYIQYSAQTHQPIRVWIEFDLPEVGQSVQGDNAHIARRLRLPDT
ncbi:hypothetical protein ACOMHN_053246 [Nucella lapillus]